MIFFHSLLKMPRSRRLPSHHHPSQYEHTYLEFRQLHYYDIHRDRIQRNDIEQFYYHILHQYQIEPRLSLGFNHPNFYNEQAGYFRLHIYCIASSAHEIRDAIHTIYDPEGTELGFYRLIHAGR